MTLNVVTVKDVMTLPRMDRIFDRRVKILYKFQPYSQTLINRFRLRN